MEMMRVISVSSSGRYVKGCGDCRWLRRKFEAASTGRLGENCQVIAPTSVSYRTAKRKQHGLFFRELRKQIVKFGEFSAQKLKNQQLHPQNQLTLLICVIWATF